MYSNQNSNGQQQPYVNQQFPQQMYQQPINPAQQSYSQPTQQAFAGHPVTQQLPPQQIAPYTEQQQQPAYQTYQQGSISAIQTPAPVAQSWSQAMPSSHWQSATNNATTTTITTTTTSSTKQREASRPQYGAASYAGTNFSSVTQQPLQPRSQQQQLMTTGYLQSMQTTPQPQLQQQQQQITTDYSQLMQSVPQQQPQQQQSITNFSQSMQVASPQPQQTLNFSQLMQSAPQQSESQASNSVTTTTTSTTKVVGEASRQQAAARGDAELRRFDSMVNERLQILTGSICPMGFDYYATNQGYLRGGGSYFFAHDEIEAMLRYGRTPAIEKVNYCCRRAITPPPGNGNGTGDEPTFWTAEEHLDWGALPLAILREQGGRRRLERLCAEDDHMLGLHAAIDGPSDGALARLGGRLEGRFSRRFGGGLGDRFRGGPRYGRGRHYW